MPQYNEETVSVRIIYVCLYKLLRIAAIGHCNASVYTGHKGNIMLLYLPIYGLFNGGVSVTDPKASDGTIISE
jgi:hypothetical protein